MRYAALCLVTCALVAAGGAHAIDSKNRYLILGPGSNSCSVVLTDLAEGIKRKNDAAEIIYSMWLSGSLSGYDHEAKGTYSILGDMSFNEAFAWTLDFCKEHPQSIYSAAVDAFIAEYRDDRYKTKPED